MSKFDGSFVAQLHNSFDQRKHILEHTVVPHILSFPTPFVATIIIIVVVIVIAVRVVHPRLVFFVQLHKKIDSFMDSTSHSHEQIQLLR